MKTNSKDQESVNVKSKDQNAIKTTPLKDLFINELRSIYWVEQALVKALPKMAVASTTAEVQEAFEDHLKETEEQVKRLDEVFSLLNIKPGGVRSESMERLIKESEASIEETADDSMVRDVALICNVQKVEHLEIAYYGSLRAIAKELEYDDIAALLQTSLDEETKTDRKLTQIAESSVNEEANQE